jgi:very-short-patch-repair endonuclease
MMKNKGNNILTKKSLITGQIISPELQERAKALRQEMTPWERKLWVHLRGNRLGGFHFRRQQIIDGYIVDFFCHAARLVVEVDGSGHLDQQEYDQSRDEHLSVLGLKVLRFFNSDVDRDINHVLEVILRACMNGEESD